MHETHTQIAIIGNGFSGMGAAIRLREAGFTDFLIFDRGQDVGGTWRDNTYPGCACDVQSVLYSFSFAQNPGWQHTFSRQPDIQAYLQGVARDYDLRPRMRFGHELQGARWDDAAKLWHIDTSQGRYTAEVLVSGMGSLCEPAYPQLPGLESFQGKTFHSARWDHGVDLRGKRVAVLGSGASAIQFVPAIQPEVGKLTLFQRTPAWIIPRMDRAISERERALYRDHPELMKLSRALTWARREFFVLGFRSAIIGKLFELFARAYLRIAVPDPVLREKLTPDFRIGCKRILVTSDYLPALGQPNVEVLRSGIREVRPHGVVAEDGSEHPIDVLILGTGFQAANPPYAQLIRGRDGRTLAERWAGSPKAHLGTMVADVPNFFALLGPNTSLAHSSVVLQIESQLSLLVGALEHMRSRRLQTIEPSPQAQARFISQIDRAMDGTAWTSGGCSSWYLDQTGRNSTLWPGYTFSFRHQVRFRPEEYVFDGAEKRATAHAFGTPITA